MRPPHPLAALCTLSLGALALAGCGSDEPARANGRALAIELSEYRFTPQVARVPTGTVTLALTNTGRLAHNLVLTRNGRERLKVDTLLPRRSTRVTVNLRGGDYRMLCSVSNHEDLGQYGILQVRREP